MIAAQASLHGDRDVGIDVPVPGINVQIHGKVAWDRSAHAAIVSVNLPRAGHLRSGVHVEIDMTITGREIETIETSLGLDVAVAGMPPQDAVEMQGFDRTIAALQARFALHTFHADMAVGGIHVQASVLW